MIVYALVLTRINKIHFDIARDFDDAVYNAQTLINGGSVSSLHFQEYFVKYDEYDVIQITSEMPHEACRALIDVLALLNFEGVSSRCTNRIDTLSVVSAKMLSAAIHDKERAFLYKSYGKMPVREAADIIATAKHPAVTESIRQTYAKTKPKLETVESKKPVTTASKHTESKWICQIHGVRFNTLEDAALSLGISVNTLKSRLYSKPKTDYLLNPERSKPRKSKANFVDESDKPKKRGGHGPTKKVSIDGVIYDSMKIASKETGIAYQTVSYRVKKQFPGYFLVD